MGRKAKARTRILFGGAFLGIAVSLQGQQEPAPTPPLAVWEKEPTTFRGIPWTANEQQAAAMMKDLDKATPNCHPIRMEQRMCGGQFRLNEVLVSYSLFFWRDRFAAVSLGFDEDDWFRLKGVFLERYGQPSRTEQIPKQTRAGGQFVSERFEWKGKTVIAAIEQYGTSIDRSTGSFQVIETTKEMIEYEEQKRKKAADAL